jgi:3-oxoadipyl-CoA thiolase
MIAISKRSGVIVDYVRSPIGRYGGSLSAVRPDDLAARVIRALVERNGVKGEAIDDVVWGAANQSGEDNRNVARMAALLAGLPQDVPGCTVNRLCASGLEAVNLAATAIEAGRGDLFIAGGSESMSRAPFVMPKNEKPFERAPAIYDTTIGWRFVNPRLAERYDAISMGETAENVAAEFSIDRDEQDAFALRSQERAARAQAAGLFAREILPMPELERDEHPRATTAADLARLKPAFRKNGSVTAGNSSGINDGAAALLLCTLEVAEKNGWKPLGRVVTSAVAGVNPLTMGLGPVPATRKALERAGLAIGDIDVVELNEAFAVQSLACMRELGMDGECTNINGGAIALGHPLGCSGARLAGTTLLELDRRQARYGLATMCIGVGQGAATIFERF